MFISIEEKRKKFGAWDRYIGRIVFYSRFLVWALGRGMLISSEFSFDTISFFLYHKNPLFIDIIIFYRKVTNKDEAK